MISIVGVFLVSLFVFKDSSYLISKPANITSKYLHDIKTMYEEKFRDLQELRKIVENQVKQNKTTDKIDNPRPIVNCIKANKTEASQPSHQSRKNEPNIRLLNEDDVKPFNGQILFLVFSHIGNIERRTTIRRTWGDPTNFPKQRALFKNATYKVFFITGFVADQIEKAKTESKTHRDLLITNRTENYFDISRRTQFGIQWTLKNCKFDYFFKTDDDVFLSIPNAYKFFYQDPFAVEHNTSLYAGYMHIRGGPIRDKGSKWHVSKKLWGEPIYPPFATGMAIILSRNVAERIEPYFEWKNVFPLEDVNIGFYVFIARVPNVGVRAAKRAEFVLDYTAAVCNRYRPETITMHPVKKEACMRKLMQASLA